MELPVPKHFLQGAGYCGHGEGESDLRACAKASTGLTKWDFEHLGPAGPLHWWSFVADSIFGCCYLFLFLRRDLSMEGWP